MDLPVVYVINLARNTARLEMIGTMLDGAGLRWVRIDAIDGRQFGELPWDDFDAFAYRYLWAKNPHPNELGCYFSHLRAL